VVLAYSEALKEITATRARPDDIKAQAIREGMATLRKNAVMKLLEDKGTCEEVLRVTWAGPEN